MGLEIISRTKSMVGIVVGGLMNSTARRTQQLKRSAASRDVAAISGFSFLMVPSIGK